MAYLQTIVHASRNFEGAAWSSHNAPLYRLQVDTTGSSDWAIINSVLYSKAFTGQAEQGPSSLPLLPSKLPPLAFVNVIMHQQMPLLLSLNVSYSVVSSSSIRHSRLLGSYMDAIELCSFQQTKEKPVPLSHCWYAHICSRCWMGPHLAAKFGKHSASRPPCTSSGSLSPWRGMKQPSPLRSDCSLLLRCMHVS